jgi:hypothetical protein
MMNLLAIPHGGWFDSLPNPWRLVVRQGFYFPLSRPMKSCQYVLLSQGVLPYKK